MKKTHFGEMCNHYFKWQLLSTAGIVRDLEELHCIYY